MKSNINGQNNECILFYEISTFQENVQIFGKNFCNNNKNNCKIVINGEEKEIFENYVNENLEKNLTIKLIMDKNITTDLSYMFNGCSCLSSISDDFSKWDTKNITKMKWMFYGCNSLKIIPDISNWDISNVTDIQFIFSNCKSLTKLPDIAKWNLKNITNINGLFSTCPLLKSLPDISKWNTSNIKNINNLFSSCTSLISLPDISKWNTSKITDMSFLFHECIALLSLPDISQWDTSKVTNMSYMFSKCLSLQSLPDISKWNINNTIDISFMFNNCLTLQSLPDLSQWNTSNVINMNSLFLRCHLLSSLPDLSKWDTINVTNMTKLFSECASLKQLPDISKWNTSSVTEMGKMFSDCTSLNYIPDISGWDFSSVYDKSNMFYNCKCDFLKEKIFNDNNNINSNNNFNLNSNIDKKNIVRNEDLRFFPQIEIKFNNINNITQKMIEELKIEIRNLLKEDNFSIIEIRKGSLIVIITLQFLILKEIEKQKNNIDFNISRVLEQFSDNIKEEVKKITALIKNHSYISLGTVKPDYVDEDILYISNEENRNKIVRKIQNLSNNNNNIIQNEENNINKINLYEIGKIEDLDKFCKTILKDAEMQEKNQFKVLKDFEKFNNLFDEEIERALKYTIFEFKITHIFLTDKETNNYIREKNNCQNRETKILFHGTKEVCAIGILSTQFRDSTTHIIGKGVYFTDLLDYAWNYAKGYRNIPRVGESFSFVASEIYYDRTLIDTVYDYQKINEPVPKYGIRCCFGNFKGRKLKQKELQTYKKPFGKEYLITEKSQILPLYAVTVKRLEYIVIWRDYNFDLNNPNKYINEDFEQLKEFHRKIKRIISREFDSKIYYVKTSEEALELIERKKYNKIIIITNGGNYSYEFISRARTIIGSETIVGVSVYNIPLHIPMIKMMRNTLLLNDIDFHYKFLKAIMQNNEISLYNLKNEIINYYAPKFPEFGLGEFNLDLLRFPKFKREGRYDELSSNENEKCQIF